MSTFLALPLELRRFVYTHYFSGMALFFPDLDAPLLSAPKQLHAEALPCYYKNVQFEFGCPKHLMDFLSAIDPSAITQLAHISYDGYPLCVFLQPKCKRTSTRFRLQQLLPLFPGLQLDTLKVNDMYTWCGLANEGEAGRAYYDMEGLVNCQGYKELTYVIHRNLHLFMKPSPFMNPDFIDVVRDDQPSTWDAMIKEKDGPKSGASVKIFHYADEERREDGVRQMNSHELLLQPKESFNRGSLEIRVKRGRGANYR